MFKIATMSAPIIYLVSVVIMAVFATIAYVRLPPQVPLFYSLPTGAEQIIDTWLLVTIPIASLVSITINYFLVKKFVEQDFFVERIVRFVNIAIIVVSTYIFIKIILLVAL
ncbi:MAG: hypothetical protein UZ22_OP11002000942 [Microgenomates bacterium OLB23]|nr:MAG: hypothetical protein UZ22_OP11002000942 [Microgenomates bacterium OLB23]